jgi:hypothetical protein
LPAELTCDEDGEKACRHLHKHSDGHPMDARFVIKAVIYLLDDFILRGF